MVNERRWLILIFALYFLLAVGYSLLMPVWEAPDEPAHYHLAWHLATYGEYPSQEVNYERDQPRAYYYFGSWVIRALNTVDTELTGFQRPKEYAFTIRKPERRFEWTDQNYRFLWGVYILRWLNIVVGSVALWLNWKTFKRIAPDEPLLCLAALAFAALTPQYLHITSSVNNDTLGTLAGALLFYLGIRFLLHPTTLLGLLLIPLAILLPLLTKLTVLPVSVAVLMTLVWKWLFGFPQKRWLLYSGVLILLGAGIFYLLFPETVQFALSEIQWRLFSLRKNALTEKYVRSVSSQILWTYWGKVGWLAVGLPLWIIQLLTGLGVIGMILHIYSFWLSWSSREKPQVMATVRFAKQIVPPASSTTAGKTFLPNTGKHPSVRPAVSRLQLDLWLAVWLIAVFTVLAVFRNGLTTFATQGRLLFPAIGALSLLMVSGWHYTLPARMQQHLPLVVIFLFLFCNLLLWQTGVIPIYYQPFFD